MSAARHLLHPRDEIMQTMERIYRYRMTTTSGGNLSIREPNGDVWITPARVDKGSLTRDDIVCVKVDGSTIGPHPASSELPFHQAIYAARPEVRGVVHAHPVALVTFSIARQLPDTRLFHQARSVCGKVGMARYALPGSAKLGENIAGVFAQGFDCVVLENHGVVVGGESLQQAFQRFETLEFTAKTILKARLLGEVRYLTDEQTVQPRASVRPLPEFDPSPASAEERELRRTLCDFVRRGYRQRLLISTEGSFSVRLEGDSFLITPYGRDRGLLEIDDLVLISDGKAERGKTASRAAAHHGALYRRHPHLGAIANAYPVNATAFSATAAELDCRTIPESYVVLRDVQRVPFGEQFRDGRGLAERISAQRPIAVLENDGVLVTGGGLLETFDRLEVLEATAEALINSRLLGELTVMPDSAIEELRTAFFGSN
ncbi:MAG: class II aldolase/adducin family protein [Pirellulaceae bacterium]